MTTDIARQGVAYARANWGRWVVDCPRPYCRDALTMPPGTPGMICPSCGTRSDVVWPADAALIQELLLARPDVATRSWEPGETATGLLAENLAHGITHATRPELDAAASRLILDAGGDTPRLRLLDVPLVIDACPMPAAIGA